MANDPVEPDVGERDGPRVLSRAFWIMMGFAALCMGAAVVFALAGPALFAPPLAHGPESAREPARSAASVPTGRSGPP
jgi:hypothetical protein